MPKVSTDFHVYFDNTYYIMANAYPLKLFVVTDKIRIAWFNIKNSAERNKRHLSKVHIPEILIDFFTKAATCRKGTQWGGTQYLIIIRTVSFCPSSRIISSLLLCMFLFSGYGSIFTADNTGMSSFVKLLASPFSAWYISR